MPYAHCTPSWLNDAIKAVKENDSTAALNLLGQLVDKDRRSMLSTLGIWNPIPCCECEHYIPDPDPVDPGWPMMCDDCGRDMVEPFATCWWGEPAFSHRPEGN